MKIVCTNLEDCGFTEKINEKNKKNENATTCPHCGAIAFYYSNDYTPIYKKKYTSLDIENIILKGILAIQSKEK